MLFLIMTKMKLLIIATLIFTTSSQQPIEKKCKGLYFNNRYYDIDIIKDGVSKIQQLILNRNDNNVYFIFEQVPMIGALGYLNIDTKEAGVINGIRNASSIAIDQMFNKIYVGGQDGIYKINNYNRSPDKLPVYDSIQSMYFKDVLFYTNTRNEAYMFDDGKINPVFELQYVHPQKIILDDDHNIFFTEGNELFRVRLLTRVVNTHERYKTAVLTTDVDDKPYISTKDGIYTYNKYKYVFDKVSDVTGIKGLTFNKLGDPIYAVADFIVKLTPNPNRCIEPIYYNN